MKCVTCKIAIRLCVWHLQRLNRPKKTLNVSFLLFFFWLIKKSNSKFDVICQNTCLIMWLKNRPLALHLWPYDPLIKWTIHLIRLRIRSGPRPPCSRPVYFQLAFSLPKDSSRQSLATCHPVPFLPAPHGNRSTQAPVAAVTTCSCFVSGGWRNLAAQTADEIRQRAWSQANTIKIKCGMWKRHQAALIRDTFGCVAEVMQFSRHFLFVAQWNMQKK